MRQLLGELGFTARCRGCMSLLRRTARQAQTEESRKVMEASLKGTTEAEVAQRRTKEYMDRAVEAQKETAGQTDEGMRAQGSGKNSSSSGAMAASGR